MSSKQGNIGVTSENIFPIIKKFLYSDHEIFLRELVSNAVDATQKLKTLSSVGEFKGELGDLTVQVKFDDKTITISDRGIGMTAEEIDKYINQIAFSGAEEFVEKYKKRRRFYHRSLRSWFLLLFHGFQESRDRDEIVQRRRCSHEMELRRYAGILFGGNDERGSRYRYHPVYR